MSGSRGTAIFPAGLFALASGRALPVLQGCPPGLGGLLFLLLPAAQQVLGSEFSDLCTAAPGDQLIGKAMELVYGEVDDEAAPGPLFQFPASSSTSASEILERRCAAE